MVAGAVGGTIHDPTEGEMNENGVGNDKVPPLEIASKASDPEGADGEVDPLNDDGCSARRAAIVTSQYSSSCKAMATKTSMEIGPRESSPSMAKSLLSPLRVLPKAAAASRWPLLFERATPSWWNPRFDSSILEEQYWKTTFPGTARRFRFGLVYLLALLLGLAVYFLSIRAPSWRYFLSFGVVVFAAVSAVLGFTLTGLYQRHCYKVSIVTSLVMCSMSLLLIAGLDGNEEGDRDISPAGLFSIYLGLLLLLYVVVPLPLYATILVGISYSVLFEALLVLAVPERIAHPSTTALNILIHLCIHFIGIHSLITSQVRMRDTFMKVGQSMMVKKQLVAEKGIKEKMILSVMPPKVADWLMKEGHGGDEDDDHQTKASKAKGRKRRGRSATGNDWGSNYGSESSYVMRKISSPRSSNQGDIRSIFRPFNMNTIDNVSILFADIVGFTSMSSDKSASQLVGLLNDLFGRFDYLCTACGCEKISTLGDCYYCVSGCPEPVPDHAKNCVEMGLAMISAIKEFDEDRHESVNMRVGIHTGTVLCGIVGKRRFKFDVWSNDVNLANKMESSGRPGEVHISEKTYKFLKDKYFVLDGDPVKNMKTYFISGRASVEEESERAKDSNGASNRLAEASRNSSHLTVRGSGNPTNAKNSKFSLSNPMPAIKMCHNKNKGLSDDVGDDQVQSMSKSLFSLATKTYAKFECKVPEVAVVPDGKDVSGKSKLQAEMSFPSLANYNSILNRRCSHSLPSLQHSRDFSAILGVGVGGEDYELCDGLSKQDANAEHSEAEDDSKDGAAGSPARKQLATLKVQSDEAMIRCVKDDESHQKIFTRPPLKRFSLFFRNPAAEHEYRRTAWQANDDDFNRCLASAVSSRRIWSPSVFNAYFDLLISCLTFGIVCLATFLHYPITWPWLLYFCFAFVYHAFVVFVFAVQVTSLKSFCHGGAITRLYNWSRGWIPSHCFGLLLTSLPMFAIFANFSCEEVEDSCERDFFLQLVYVGLVHFCNLSALNYFVKSLMATLCAAVVAVLNSPITCGVLRGSGAGDNATFAVSDGLQLGNRTSTSLLLGDTATSLFIEATLCIVMLLTLIWMVNREFETAYRISFHCSLISAEDRKKIQNLKNQADWLLHNIIPKHIADSLKRSSGYSENHKEVGIIFASLVNFNELYDESYMGGREFLRVLNELISDIDEVLDKPEYKNVEKIKTIGATFMAASGMNPFIRQENTHKFQHIHELMEFVFELQQSIKEFNQSLIEFDLLLRVGFNFGDVTAGVIGTTKLYYDIWGDAVNIASRMETTGVEGRIQVIEKCMHVLSEWYTFELRGSVFVKGKNNMTTYLLVGNKPDAVVSAVCLSTKG